MRKECRTLCGLFVVLITFCVTLSAVCQQSNTASTVLEYTKKVDLSELVDKVDNLSQSVDTLTENQKLLITDVEDLKDTIARIDERTEMTFTIVVAGIIALLAALITIILQNRSAKKQMHQYIQQPVFSPIELDRKEQEEQRTYEYEPEGATS